MLSKIITNDLNIQCWKYIWKRWQNKKKYFENFHSYFIILKFSWIQWESLIWQDCYIIFGDKDSNRSKKVGRYCSVVPLMESGITWYGSQDAPRNITPIISLQIKSQILLKLIKKLIHKWFPFFYHENSWEKFLLCR